MWRAESCLSNIAESQPRLKNETTGKYYWRLIRHSVKDAIKILKKADINEIIVRHGIHYDRILAEKKYIKNFLYNSKRKLFVLLDNENIISLYERDGRKACNDIMELSSTTRKIDALLYCIRSDLYIAYKYGKRKLFLLDKQFAIVSDSKAEMKIDSILYNENFDQLLTLGCGFFTSWVFRYGGRHVLPKKCNDKSYPENCRLTITCLEDTGSLRQKLFAVYKNGVKVFKTYTLQMLTEQNDMHDSHITSLCFFNPLKFLCSGSKDGCIKMWNEEFNVQMLFVGHRSEIYGLCAYPYGPAIISSAKDSTLRIWSLETCDQVDIIEADGGESYMNLVTNINDDMLCCKPVAGSNENRNGGGGKSSSSSLLGIRLWKIKNVHKLHTTMTSKVLRMKMQEKFFPSSSSNTKIKRCLNICRDNSLRLICPCNGQVLTSLLINRNVRILDAAYSINDDLLFSCMENGSLIKSTSKTNPSKILKIWNDFNINCLLIYNYNKGKSKAISLLIAGRKDGRLCTINYNDESKDGTSSSSGSKLIGFELLAHHGSQGVTLIVENSRDNQIISAGSDNIIKVWRVYPYSAYEAFTPLLSFYCAHTPIEMTVLRNELAVAFQDDLTATYSLVYYNLNDKTRKDHSPENDHLDSITALTSCHKLNLIASASKDRTIRIWNADNTLVRLIEINSVVDSVSFADQKGGLLVGIGENVHWLDYKTYMPKEYRLKMISMRFESIMDEESLEWDDDLLAVLNNEERKRLKGAQSSSKRQYTHAVDLLTGRENEELKTEQEERQEAFDTLTDRNNELNLIINGVLEPNKKIKLSKSEETNVRKEAFNKYLSAFYNVPDIALPKDDPFPEDRFNEKFQDFMAEKRHTEAVRYMENEERAVCNSANNLLGMSSSNSTSTSGKKALYYVRGFFPGNKKSVKEQFQMPNSLAINRYLSSVKSTGGDDDGGGMDDNWQPPVLSQSQMEQVKEYKHLSRVHYLSYTDSSSLKFNELISEFTAAKSTFSNSVEHRGSAPPSSIKNQYIKRTNNNLLSSVDCQKSGDNLKAFIISKGYNAPPKKRKETIQLNTDVQHFHNVLVKYGIAHNLQMPRFSKRRHSSNSVRVRQASIYRGANQSNMVKYNVPSRSPSPVKPQQQQFRPRSKPRKEWTEERILIFDYKDDDDGAADNDQDNNKTENGDDRLQNESTMATMKDMDSNLLTAENTIMESPRSVSVGDGADDEGDNGRKSARIASSRGGGKISREISKVANTTTQRTTNFMDKMQDVIINGRENTFDLTTPPRTPTPPLKAVKAPATKAALNKETLDTELKNKRERLEEIKKSKIVAPPTSSVFGDGSRRTRTPASSKTELNKKSIPPPTPATSPKSFKELNDYNDDDDDTTRLSAGKSERKNMLDDGENEEKLPFFIRQFIDEEWMKKYFPNCSEVTMPKPWTINNFSNMIARLLRIADYPLKVQIIRAINTLIDHQSAIDDDDDDDNTIAESTIITNLQSVLNHHTNAPRCDIEIEREFIIGALKLLVLLDAAENKRTWSELIFYFTQADKIVGQVITDIFKDFGFKRTQYMALFAEFDEWCKVTAAGNDIRQQAGVWLDKWKKSGGNDATSSSSSYLDGIKKFIEKKLEGKDKEESLKEGEKPNTVLVLPYIASDKPPCLVRLGLTRTSQFKYKRLSSATKMRDYGVLNDKFMDKPLSQICLHVPSINLDPFKVTNDNDEKEEEGEWYHRKYFFQRKSYAN